MKKFNLKSNKGITLIALIITIIVLLILAGVTIAAINGNESAMDKAKQAKDETSISEAKEAAILKATALIQDYMDRRYVKNEANFATTYPKTGNYVAASMNNVTEGDYTFTTSGTTLTVSKSETSIVTGTIDEDTGKITWNRTGNVDPADNPNSVYSLAKAGTVEVGQKIGNYVPQNKEITDDDLNLPEGASIERRKLASIDGVQINNSDNNANKITDWVVLDVDQTTGKILIVPDTRSNKNSYVDLYLSGMDGYNNSIKALNLVAGMYTDSKFAESARSITVEDVNNIAGYEISSSSDGDLAYSWDNEYGMNDNLDIVYQGGNTTEIATETYDSETETKKTIKYNYKVYNSTPKTEYYEYNIDGSNYGFLCSRYFWLASRCVNLNSGGCSFNVRILHYGNVNSDDLFYVSGDGSPADYSHEFFVLPVVSLKSGINMTWDETNSAWNLSV